MARPRFGAIAMGNARLRDFLDTQPRFTLGDVARLNARLSGLSAENALRVMLEEKLAGELCVVSSFGAESAVLLHLVAGIDRDLPVLFLDTGKHFAETLGYRDQLIAHLGLRDVRILTPDAHDLAARDAAGERWTYDPDGCCALRKVQPLARALATFDASLTGRKGFQAATRTALPFVELDTSDAAGRIKINPLANWLKADIDRHFAEHALPRHPLVAAGYLSIGCAPCTSPVRPGEDARAGRWRGFDKVECGIHDSAAR